MIHFLNSIGDPRCDCDLGGEETGTDDIEDVTCAACVRLYMEGELIRMEYDMHEEIKKLQNQVQALLRVTVSSFMDDSAVWAGQMADYNNPSETATYPYSSANVCFTKEKSLSDALSYRLEKGPNGYYEVVEDTPPMVTLPETEDTDEKAPTMWDHLLGK